jgi:hypothetical protein
LSSELAQLRTLRDVLLERHRQCQDDSTDRNGEHGRT